MTESQHVYKPMRDGCPQVDWQRFENLVGMGAADVNGCCRGTEAWIENKIIHGNQIKFQPQQPAWLLKRQSHGGNVFILARKDDAFWLYGGKQLRQLLRSCKPLSNGCLVAEYRIVAPNLVLQKPYNWELFAGYVFGHEPVEMLKAA
jgi:hypothetical protein